MTRAIVRIETVEEDYGPNSVHTMNPQQIVDELKQIDPDDLQDVYRGLQEELQGLNIKR